MPTQIFASYAEFLQREDKTLNGVHESFAQVYPYWEKDNTTNTGCWNCKQCKKCIDCINCTECFKCTNCIDTGFSKKCANCFAVGSCENCLDCRICANCNNCNNCMESSYCISCNNCLSCSYSKKCEDCAYCGSCENCINVYNKENGNGIRVNLAVPVVPAIHQKMLEAVSLPDTLNMGAWHTCDTTHCRAGWVVVLAGEAGRIFEFETNTAFAAMLIYKASSPILVTFKDFYTTNEKAKADIERCAELEKNLPATV